MAVYTPIRTRGSELFGRQEQCEALDRLIDAVSRGASRVLVVRGEPGVGKTALLEHLAERAVACRVERAVGVEAEMELAFAGTHQLCAPMLDQVSRLPASQGEALLTAFGLSSSPAPDRFLVALAVLGLLAEVAEEQPLICIVDDHQWLDRASSQVLAFVARRLEAEAIGLVFASRGPSTELGHLPALALEGLNAVDAHLLLESVLSAPLDPAIRHQIVSETRGNPLALQELVRGYTPAELAGGFGLPRKAPVEVGVEESFRQRLEDLPGASRLLVRLAAADPTGEPELIWRAAKRLGISAQDATAVAAAGLLEIVPTVRFHHPLVRSAVYRSTPLHERQRVHGALAQATDPGLDPDRRAWHLAHATSGPDEDVAQELERSAGRAQARGGVAAAAAFLERSAALTPDPRHHAERLLAAARAKRAAGAIDEALGLLATLEADPLGLLHAAELQRLRGQLAFDQRRMGDAAPLLLDAARRLGELDHETAREAHVEALGAALWAGCLGAPGIVRDAAEAARAAPRPLGPPRAVDLILDALALRVTDGYTAAAPAMAGAVKRYLALGDRWTDVSECPLASAGAVDLAVWELWDADRWHSLSMRQVILARETGALVHLQFTLALLCLTHVLGGELSQAALLVEEDRQIVDATTNTRFTYPEALLAAFRGEEAAAFELMEAVARHAEDNGLGRVLDFVGWLASVLCNGLGRHEEARDAARQVFERDPLGQTSLVVSELAEAAARTGDMALVKSAHRWISERARVTSSDWLLGIEARIAALMSECRTAERSYRESIERLASTRLRVEAARSHLLYGEWLRRERRRLDAREQLRTAYEQLAAMGVGAFAARAKRELLATGETVRKRTVATRDELTAQEAQIASLARDGLSNPEIAAHLFISPRTVQYHLSKVFAKLDIGSRRQLEDVLHDASR